MYGSVSRSRNTTVFAPVSVACAAPRMAAGVPRLKPSVEAMRCRICAGVEPSSTRTPASWPSHGSAESGQRSRSSSGDQPGPSAVSRTV
jgi:hypothetical protein